MILTHRLGLVNAAPVGSHEHAGKCTVHQYSHSAMITLGDLTTVQVTGIAHYFKCVETGVVRQYGFDAPSGHGEKAPAKNA